MFVVEAMQKSFEWHLEFSAAMEPAGVNAIAGAIKIAAPKPIETHQNVTPKRPKFFQLIGERDCRTGVQMRDRPEWPFGFRPVASGNELSFAFTAKIQDQAVAVSGKGSIDGNSIRASINAMGHDSNFSGTRTPRE